MPGKYTDTLNLWKPYHGRAGFKVYDASTGKGGNTRIMLKAGFDVTCSNFDEERGEGIPQEARYVGGVDLNQPLPFDDDSFDGANLTDVIEHLENPAQTIREFIRVLRPDGIFVLSTPNTLNATSRLRFLVSGFMEGRKRPIGYAKPTGNAGNVYIPNLILLHYLLAQSGATIEKLALGFYHWHAPLLSIPLYPLFWFGATMETARVRRRSMLHHTKRVGVPDSEMARLQKCQRKVNAKLKRLILSKEVLWGRNLIIRARNAGLDPFDV
jgi:SAM-dependent methyltransferase